MQGNKLQRAGLLLVMAAALAIASAGSASAAIDGVTGTTFSFTATDGHIQAGDGRSLYVWGFANSTSTVQYPGPTLKLAAGDTVDVTLTNDLPVSTSIVFPGMDIVSTVFANETSGPLTTDVRPGGTATYTFTAANPGTYYYHSATNPDIQVEMGLFGAIVVYPADNPEVGGAGAYHAYNDVGANDWNSHYDREFLFLESEMDENVHDGVEDAVLANPANPDLSQVDSSAFSAVYWFLNGRNAPDTMMAAGVPWMPTQPYNCAPMMYPGQRLLMRVVNMGRDPHPFHHHGNHARIIAQDGRLLSTTGTEPDLAREVFTIPTGPGQTDDAIFQWTGEGLGFDVYGHTDPAGPLEPFEDPTVHGLVFPDTGTALPTPIPNKELLTFGQFYTGSPFLGGAGPLPPGEGGFNPNNAYTYMWHSHNEKEMVNNDIFPGGLMTILFVEPWPAVP